MPCPTTLDLPRSESLRVAAGAQHLIAMHGSQAAAAKAVGLNRETLKKALGAPASLRVTPDTLSRIAQGLGVTVEQLRTQAPTVPLVQREQHAIRRQPERV